MDFEPILHVFVGFTFKSSLFTNISYQGYQGRSERLWRPEAEAQSYVPVWRVQLFELLGVDTFSWETPQARVQVLLIPLQFKENS